jgi:hypothetical protein
MTATATTPLLAHLMRGGAFGHFWLPPDGTLWWPADCPPAAPQHPKVYYGVHPVSAIPPTNAHGQPRAPRWVRSQNAYIAAVNCLYAEFDLKDFAGDVDYLFGHIAALPAAPSVWALSGGGVHCYWLLTDPFIIASDDHRAAIAYIQRAWVRFVGGDPGAADLARPLRLPGTLNYKYTPPRLADIIICDLDRTYALGDLTAYLPPPSPSAPRSAAPQPTAAGPRPIDTFNQQVNIADLLERYGYQRVGRRMLSPYSTTGQPGVTIDETTNRAFVHHGSDPLCTGHWKRPFDVVTRLDFGGDWRAALDAIRRAI